MTHHISLPHFLGESNSSLIEYESEGAMASQTGAPTPEEPPELKVEGSGKALLTKTAPDRERVLETTREILGRIHTLHLQTMHEMGSM